MAFRFALAALLRLRQSIERQRTLSSAGCRIATRSCPGYACSPRVISGRRRRLMTRVCSPPGRRAAELQFAEPFTRTVRKFSPSDETRSSPPGGTSSPRSRRLPASVSRARSSGDAACAPTPGLSTRTGAAPTTGTRCQLPASTLAARRLNLPDATRQLLLACSFRRCRFSCRPLLLFSKSLKCRHAAALSALNAGNSRLAAGVHLGS